MKADDNPLLILGGTGHYGRHIVKSLLAKGAAVRVLTRSPIRARGILGEGPEIVTGDITSREAVVAALTGVKAVMVCVSAFSWRGIKRIRQVERDAVLMVLEETEQAGIQRVVYTSGYEMREEVINRLHIRKMGEIKLEIEAILARSALNWTILGCAPSMELFFTFHRSGRMTVPGGGPPSLPTISPHDVGEIAAQALLRTDLGGKRFRLTGPEALSFPDAAKQISDQIGRPVKVIRIPLLPLKLAGILTRPINPFVQYLYWSVKLLNHFPPDLAAQVPQDHALLKETFDYSPVTFEMEAQKRLTTQS